MQGIPKSGNAKPAEGTKRTPPRVQYDVRR